MNTHQYQKFWTLMVFLLSFCVGLAFLGAVLINNKMAAKMISEQNNHSFLSDLMSLPANCGGRAGGIDLE